MNPVPTHEAFQRGDPALAQRKGDLGPQSARKLSSCCRPRSRRSKDGPCPIINFAQTSGTTVFGEARAVRWATGVRIVFLQWIRGRGGVGSDSPSMIRASTVPNCSI